MSWNSSGVDHFDHHLLPIHRGGDRKRTVMVAANSISTTRQWLRRASGTIAVVSYPRHKHLPMIEIPAEAVDRHNLPQTRSAYTNATLELSIAMFCCNASVLP